jgi:hypothetical protein
LATDVVDSRRLADLKPLIEDQNVTPEGGTAMTSDNKPIAIYYEMRRQDEFEATAGRLWSMVRTAARDHPGAPRVLYMDMEGHKDFRGEYDDDAMKLGHFVRTALGPFLTKTPWGRADETAPQSEDLPETIMFSAGHNDVFVILTGDYDRPFKLHTEPDAQ